MFLQLKAVDHRVIRSHGPAFQSRRRRLDQHKMIGRIIGYQRRMRITRRQRRATTPGRDMRDRPTVISALAGNGTKPLVNMGVSTEHEIYFCLVEQRQVSGMSPTSGVAPDIENGVMQKNYFPRSLRRQQIFLGEGKLLVGFFLEAKIQSQHVYWSNVIR